MLPSNSIVEQLHGDQPSSGGANRFLLERRLGKPEESTKRELEGIGQQIKGLREQVDKLNSNLQRATLWPAEEHEGQKPEHLHPFHRELQTNTQEVARDPIASLLKG